jgi:hypothetical protein
MPCGQRFKFRMPDGRIAVKQLPCRVKACETCGPRLRQQWAAELGHAMGGDQVYRLVVRDDELARLRRRKVLRGHEVAVIPATDVARVVYSTAAIGEPVRHLSPALAADFAAMPSDSRRRSISAGWAQVIADAQAEAAASREPWECLGRVGRSLEQVELVARELGVLVGRTPDMVIVAAMAPPTEYRFNALVKLQRGRHRREVAA